LPSFQAPEPLLRAPGVGDPIRPNALALIDNIHAMQCPGVHASIMSQKAGLSSTLMTLVSRSRLSARRTTPPPGLCGLLSIADVDAARDIHVHPRGDFFCHYRYPRAYLDIGPTLIPSSIAVSISARQRPPQKSGGDHLRPGAVGSASSEPSILAVVKVWVGF
jgi:hypothetical protein